MAAITSLNDNRPIALTLVIMKSMEKLVLYHIKSVLPSTMDSHQYAYSSNRSTDMPSLLPSILYCATSNIKGLSQCLVCVSPGVH